MANPIYYYDGLEDAILTYSATEDTGFTAENLKDRYKNTFFKDTAMGVPIVTIVIDFGSAKSCDSIVLGNYLATADNNFNFTLECNSADAWGAPTTALATVAIGSATLTDAVFSFSAQNFRYWRMVFNDSGAGDVLNIQIAIILLGTKLSHTVNRNWGAFDGRLSNISLRTTKGGVTFSNKNGEKRKIYEMFWEDVGNTHRGNIMTWLETVDNNYLPFYLDYLGDGTLLLMRKQGVQGGLRDKDFQVEDTDRFTFIEQL